MPVPPKRGPKGAKLYSSRSIDKQSERNLPARQPVRRKQRRQVRPLARQAVRPPEAATQEAATPSTNGGATEARPARQQPQVSATRMALMARSAELARLDVEYMRHDLRNVALIAGLMLAIVIVLYFLHV